MWCPALASFQIGDSPPTQSGAFGEFFLTQPRCEAVALE
jgi:hypothetical protein